MGQYALLRKEKEMKKIAVVLLLIVIVFALSKLNSHKEKDYLVKINNYTITLQEFNEDFLASAFAKNNTPESRKEFLNMLIRRKLVLQDAQAMGLDKDKEFLKSIERFWEMSLLKRAMDKKSQEISGSVSTPDNAIEAVYNKLKSEGKADKPYNQMYGQIKRSLTQLQESQALNKWLVALYKKASIKINPVYVSKQSENAVSASKPAQDIKSVVAAKDVKNTKAIKVNKGKK
ncbi:MAG: SurA N-terminal domain-containing protein [Candidatus Omnitrophota bacterium]